MMYALKPFLKEIIGCTMEVCSNNKKHQLLCGGLKENSPSRLTANDIIRRCGLVRVGVALLDEMGYWR